MAEEKIFVGRKGELKQFEEVLKEPKGQAVLVVGQAGMGKTWLVNKFAEIAGKHPELKCGAIRYEVTSNDSVDAVMERMMNDAFNAGIVVEGSFDFTEHRKRQWYTLLETVVPKGEKIAKLLKSFERDLKLPIREQFIERLKLVSSKMQEEGRVVFLVDPLEKLNENSAEEWTVVVRELPDKVKFVFAQRSNDVLATYPKFMRESKVVAIPKGELKKLKKQEVDELISYRVKETEYTTSELASGLEKYDGHPFAVQGAINLLAGRRVQIERLPTDPTSDEEKRGKGVAEEQWKQIAKKGGEAIHLFRAYAVLEVSVPDEVVATVGEVDVDYIEELLSSDVFFEKLLEKDGDGRRIYHLLLTNVILNKMSTAEKDKYHKRAVGVYRERLHRDVKPDGLAAERLAEHVLAAEGEQAFVKAVLNESGEVLKNLGLLDAVESLLLRALEMAEEGSEKKAAVSGNLGLIYRTRGELDKAEEMHRKALEIDEKLENLEGIASDYGNLGVIYQILGELDKAEEMHKRSLEIAEKIGQQEIMAIQYGDLGLIYRRRGELEKAEEMHKKSLRIEKEGQREQGMAREYGNLGVIYMDKGELEKAEEMHLKALKIDEKLGNLEGIASDYGNLGLIYQMRGELKKAEEMHKKSLEIEKKLGRLEGMASEYGNLGVIYEERGDIRKARGYWEKAVELYKRIGIPHMVEKVQGWIEGLEGKRGQKKF